MILELRNIRKTFDGLMVLDNISFGLLPGTITSLFGENGSGKTTLFHIISGFLKADSGEVVFNGADITNKTAVEAARQGIGRVWQHPRIFRNLSVSDNLILPVRSHPGEKIVNYLLRPKTIYTEEKKLRKQADVTAEELNLHGKLWKTAGSLSLGQQKLLSMGMLLMNEASLLLMDEPFAGLNPQMVEHISDVLVKLKNQGKTICLIEHNRNKASAISNEIIFIAKGKIAQNELPYES